MTEPIMLWPDDSARVRSTDPIESHIAADVSTGSIVDSHRAVFRVLEDADHPIPDREIIARAKFSYGFMLSDSRLRTARKELADDGVVEKVGQVQIGRSKHATWQLKEVA